MKLPIPFLLYTTSLALVGFTGWQVYELLPLQKKETKNAEIAAGQNSAKDKMSVGRSQGAVSSDWFYTDRNRFWWRQLQEVNFIGKPPPPPPKPEDENPVEPEVVEKPVTPLESLFELALLVYDSQDDGKGQLSHVVVRYKPEAAVQAPEWYVREMQSSGAAGSYRPGDGLAPPKRAGGNPGFQRQGDASAPPPTTPIPTAGAGPSLLLQKIWVQGKDRNDPHLWPPYEHIRLTRVDPSAQSAWFVREQPPADDEGKTIDSAEEQLFKTAANLSQDVLRALAELDGREHQPTASQNAGASGAGTTWIETDETKLVKGVHMIGREDERRFASEDDFLEKVYFDTYVSKVSDTRGLQVKNVDPQLAAKFGITQGDVLLSVNGKAVKSKGAAMNFGKKEYKKGVRTFVTKWLSGGQEVERVYQAPDK